MKVIWDYVCHGFKALAEGVHPENDPYGDPWPAGSPQAALAGKVIAGGRFYGALWGIAADLEYASGMGGAALEFEFALSTLPRVTYGRESDHTRCFAGCWLAKHLQSS